MTVSCVSCRVAVRAGLTDAAGEIGTGASEIVRLLPRHVYHCAGTRRRGAQLLLDLIPPPLGLRPFAVSAASCGVFGLAQAVHIACPRGHTRASRLPLARALAAPAVPYRFSDSTQSTHIFHRCSYRFHVCNFATYRFSVYAAPPLELELLPIEYYYRSSTIDEARTTTSS